MKLTRSVRFLLTLWALCFSLSGLADADMSQSEPLYCNPGVFDEKEVSRGEFTKFEKSGLVRTHVFKLGKVTLVGAGVGNSKSTALIDLAQRFSPKSKAKNYCTWYFNHPRGTGPKEINRIRAAETFLQKDIRRSPKDLTEAEAVAEFMETLKGTFDEEKINFLTCAAEHQFIAMGCNEMMHRGPTVFGMLLAFSGCSPEHSLEIANQIWGLNGVKRSTRLAIIRKGYELGELHKDSRKRLRDLFSDT